MSIKDKYAFVGVGLTRQGRVPELGVNELAAQAILLALEDAGMGRDELDGYIYQPGFGGASGAFRMLPAVIFTISPAGVSLSAAATVKH